MTLKTCPDETFGLARAVDDDVAAGITHPVRRMQFKFAHDLDAQSRFPHKPHDARDAVALHGKMHGDRAGVFMFRSALETACKREKSILMHNVKRRSKLFRQRSQGHIVQAQCPSGVGREAPEGRIGYRRLSHCRKSTVYTCNLPGANGSCVMAASRERQGTVTGRVMIAKC